MQKYLTNPLLVRVPTLVRGGQIEIPTTLNQQPSRRAVEWIQMGSPGLCGRGPSAAQTLSFQLLPSLWPLLSAPQSEAMRAILC